MDKETANAAERQQKEFLSHSQLSKYLAESTKAQQIFVNQNKIKHHLSNWPVSKWCTLNFAIFHTIFLLEWFLINHSQYHFDPFPYPILSIIFSIEALFLFVLISQENEKLLEIWRQ